MTMPGRQTVGGEQYRYAFQGQEKDPETGKEAFELRLWDSRIGRWLSPDPYGQFHSPYNGMGNDPINGIDPNGGYKTWFGAFFGWVGGGFEGKIGHPGGEGNKDWSVFKAKSLGEYNFDTHTFGEVLLYNDYGSETSRISSLWNHSITRSITGDAFSIGGNASFMGWIGLGVTKDYTWIIRGPDASVFPYIVYGGNFKIGDGGEATVTAFAGRKWYVSNNSSDINARDLRGLSIAADAGLAVGFGGEVGIEVALNNKMKPTWITAYGGVSGGVEISPLTAANVTVNVNYDVGYFHFLKGYRTAY